MPRLSVKYESKRGIGKASTAPTPKQIATDLKKLDKKIKRLPKPEKEYWDFPSVSDETISYEVNRVHALVLPPIGLNADERLGQEIRASSMQIRGLVNAGPSSTAPQHCRIIVLRSKQRFEPDIDDGYSPGNQAVLHYGDTNDTTISPYDPDNRAHFEVLYDKTFFVQNGTDHQTRSLNIKLGLKNKKIRFEGVSTVPESGQIWICSTSNVGTASNPPVMQFISRVMFTA